MNASLPMLHVVLPIGISFYTFQSMSYVIDVYRREIQATRHPLDFAVFVSFFPHLVAGPIMRAPTLLPADLRHRAGSRREQIIRGRRDSSWGLFKKVVVADNLATVVNAVFAQGHSTAGLEVLDRRLRVRVPDLRRLLGLHRHRARASRSAWASS